MKSVQFNFKGVLCPVLTSFNDDKNRTVNYDGIDKYASWLKQKNLHGVVVNGTFGEGTTLKLEERLRIAEEWFKACRKHQLVCMIQIGGACVAEVYEMAAHAERLGVDAVLVLPDLFYRPIVEEDLVHYLKDVAQYCPTRPLFYYHIPLYTQVRLSMPRFCDLADKEISTFCGLKYTSRDLQDGVACLKSGRTIFLGKDSFLIGGLALGFDSVILKKSIICPELALEVYDLIRNNKLQDAMKAQARLNKRVNEVCPNNVDSIVEFKKEFNKINSTFKVGPTRKPITCIAKKQY